MAGSKLILKGMSISHLKVVGQSRFKMMGQRSFLKVRSKIIFNGRVKGHFKRMDQRSF